MSHVDAVDALNEIAFWLERELAPSFKVKAFRNAAGVISGMSDDEIASRVRDGRLKPVVGAVRPLAEAPDAFAPGKRTPGRTIIRVTED